MPPTEVSEHYHHHQQVRRPQKPAAAAGAAPAMAPAGEQEHLACPRCDSTNTKFCYYNNYNFSQPRHFCKSCRRYWTHGGTLRDIPVGGGTRKNAKRSRVSSASPLPATPLLLPGSAAGFAGDAKLGPAPSFTSLLSSPGPGFLALGGFGLGLDDLGFGLGRGVWAFPGVASGGVGDHAGNGGGGARGIGIGTAWQFENGDHHHHHHHHGGLVAAVTTAGGGSGDFCSWADPMISTPASGFK